MVRQVIAWYPEEVTHACITLQHPDGRTMTAYAKHEGPGYVSDWIREEPGVEPQEGERDPLTAAWLERTRAARERKAELDEKRKRRY